MNIYDKKRGTAEALVTSQASNDLKFHPQNAAGAEFKPNDDLNVSNDKFSCDENALTDHSESEDSHLRGITKKLTGKLRNLRGIRIKLRAVPVGSNLAGIKLPNIYGRKILAAVNKPTRDKQPSNATEKPAVSEEVAMPPTTKNPKAPTGIVRAKKSVAGGNSSAVSKLTKVVRRRKLQEPKVMELNTGIPKSMLLGINETNNDNN